jgi:arginase
MKIKLIGAPVQEGAGRLGCDMGPAAFRAAGLAGALRELGHDVIDLGNVAPATPRLFHHPNAALKNLGEIVAWTEALAYAAFTESAGALPIFLGGDHSLSAGTVAGMAKRAKSRGKPFYVLWLDAHTDFHSLQTTTSSRRRLSPRI